jgi:hypothetical protein
MLNQKNIWTAKHNATGNILWKVFNNDVPYIFGIADNYIIDVESYDIHGNLIKTQ